MTSAKSGHVYFFCSLRSGAQHVTFYLNTFRSGAEHFSQRNPKIIKYLGLDDGFRFLITESGYEDVWFDENLLQT